MNAALYVASVALHILAASVWIGGMMFLVLVLVPSLKRELPPGQRILLIQRTGQRFRAVGWLSLALLVTTGFTNLLGRGVTPAVWMDATFWAGPFGEVLKYKLMVVALILATSAMHDFWVGPLASRRMLSQPGSIAADRARRAATLMGRLNLVLAVVVLALAVMLVRGHPW